MLCASQVLRQLARGCEAADVAQCTSHGRVEIHGRGEALLLLLPPMLRTRHLLLLLPMLHTHEMCLPLARGCKAADVAQCTSLQDWVGLHGGEVGLNIHSRWREPKWQAAP
jgi:hypothetical protein